MLIAEIQKSIFLKTNIVLCFIFSEKNERLSLNKNRKAVEIPVGEDTNRGVGATLAVAPTI
jgi:hypothetical protein